MKIFFNSMQNQLSSPCSRCDEQNGNETLGNEKKNQDTGSADTEKQVTNPDKGSADAEKQVTDSDKTSADTENSTIKSKIDATDAANPITPVPNADKECDASPPKTKLGNKAIKRKLKVLDATTTDDDAQPKKKNKLGGGIKTL